MGPLHYLSKPHKEVVEEYFEMFDEHIAPEWRDNNKLVELLENSEAVQVFAAAEWTGINGCEPVSFKFREDMPKDHRSAARPVSMRIF